MTKIIVAFTVFVFAITGNIFAQAGGVHVGAGDVNFSAGKMKEGVNTVTKVGQGTLTFVKKGETFSEVMFKDAAGVSTRLIPTPAGTGGAPNPECKTKLPDACFSSPDKNIGMCICKPGDISAGGNTTWIINFRNLGIFKNN